MSIAHFHHTDFQYRGVALASERNKFQFYNRIFMPSSIVLILLIVVTYFHEMRSEDRATGTGERMKE